MVKITMLGVQSTMTRHAKRQENLTQKEKNSQSIKINSEMTQMLELAEKDIKPIIITIFHNLK